MMKKRPEDLLKRVLGLNPEAIGQDTIKRGVSKRMEALGLSNLEDYTKILFSSSSELQNLIETVIVPETWFFRDKEPFLALIKYARCWKADGQIKGPIRILSIPCSTGEEPYSIAISFLEDGWSEKEFLIVGVDISKAALKQARTARYREASFREKELVFLKKYFQPEQDVYVLKPEIKKLVRFVHGNILDHSFVSGLGRYHVIFCRNLLIYLDEWAKDKALAAIEDLLCPDGILFVGHAETGRIPLDRFEALPHPKAFAFMRKRSSGDESHRKTTKIQVPSLCICSSGPSLPIGRVCQCIKRSLGRTTRVCRSSASVPQPPKVLELESIKQMADRGELDRAREYLDNYLRIQGPCPEAYFLLGVVLEAKGELQPAQKALQKAVYLEPDHYEALLLLGLVSERQGDDQKARAYMKRATRVKERLSNQL